MHYRYDIIVDTFRTQLKNTNIGFVFGPLFIFMGVFEIIISITTDTYNNSYNSNQDEINNQINYADNRQERFSEQSYEQGFWVGLFLLGTGLVGIFSSIEQTATTIYSFVCLAAISSGLSFYLLLNAIIPTITQIHNY